MSMERDQTYRRIVEQMSSDPDLGRLLTLILQSACELLQADKGSLGLVDAEASLIRIEAIYNMPDGEMGSEWPSGIGLAGRVLKTGMPVVLRRYEDVDGEIREDLAGTSVIGVPIFWRGRLTGYFGLGSAHRTFELEDVGELQHLAQHAAIAIEHARLVEESRRSVARTGLLLHTTERIGNAMSVDEVIGAYLDQVASNGRYYCTIVLYDFDEDGLKIGNVVRGRWAPGANVELLHHEIPAKQDELDPILASGQTIRIADALTDPTVPESLREEQRRDDRPAIALVPLVAEGRRIGLVILSDSRPRNWTDEELVPFQTTAVQLAAALQSRRDHDTFVETDRRLAVLDERRRLARELHDSVTQILFSLNLLAQSLEPDKISPKEITDKIVELSRRGLGDMRSLLEELRPVKPRVQKTTLRQQIAAHAATLIGLPPFSLEDSAYKKQPEAMEQQLFRIAQEALNNVAKHAQATQTRITLQSEGNSVRLRIEDDGVGMRKKADDSRTGFGLTGMQERADEIGGKIEVTSTLGRGTVVELICLGGEE